MHLFTWRRAALAILCALAVFLFTKWKAASDAGGQKPAEPFRIAGNLYYVGANDVASFLITSPEGHVLIDGGYPGTPPLITASIKKLGFDIKDVRVLLNSEPHFDHAGGLAELQRLSGATLYASRVTARTLARGGGDPDNFWLYNVLVAAGILRYRAPHVDHVFDDGAVIRLGSTAVTAHVTGGHTRGCTTWTFDVIDRGRVFHVVSAGSLTLLPGVHLVEPQSYPGIRQDFERSFATLRGLPVDIWVTSHAKEFERYRKYQASLRAGDPVAPFLDRAGYLAYVDRGEARFRKLLAKQQARR